MKAMVTDDDALTNILDKDENKSYNKEIPLVSEVVLRALASIAMAHILSPDNNAFYQLVVV